MRNLSERILQKAKWVSEHPDERGILSTGEYLAVALLLNQPSWLAELGYTLTGAIDRLGSDWLRATLDAAQVWEPL